MQSLLSRFPLVVAAAAAAVVVAGCDAVGEGEAPSGITLIPDFVGTTRQQAEAVQAFADGGPFPVAECLPATFRMLLNFDDGRTEDLQSRLQQSQDPRFDNQPSSFTFTSSNPDVLQIVGPREERLIPGTDQTRTPLTFPPAVLLPVAPGTATITVDFVGFQASMDVEVRPLGEIEAFIDFPPVIAPNSFPEVLARASFDGQTFGIVGGGVLRLEGNGLEPEEITSAEVASVNNNAQQFVFGVEPGPPLRAVLDYGICNRAPATEFRVELLPEDGLAIEREFDDGLPLGIGFSELFTVNGTFEDSNRQDLTSDTALSLDVGEGEESVGILVGTPNGGNALLFGLGGVENGSGAETQQGTGGVARLRASFSQDPTQNFPGGVAPPEGVENQPTVEAALDLPVRPALVRSVQWGEPAAPPPEGSDALPVLEVPRDCTILPDVLGEVEIALEDGSRQSTVRRINREMLYLVGDNILPDELEGDEDLPDGSGDGTDDGDAGDEPANSEPVVEVVGGGGFSAELAAGSITAVGEVGEEVIVQAVRVQDTSIPGFEENADIEDSAPRANLLVRITEPRDCVEVARD